MCLVHSYTLCHISFIILTMAGLYSLEKLKLYIQFLFYFKDSIQVLFCCAQEDTTLSESRPSTAVQTGVGGDPLSLDVEDLYVKFKV